MDFFCETEAAAISARLSLTQALLDPIHCGSTRRFELLVDGSEPKT